MEPLANEVISNSVLDWIFRGLEGIWAVAVIVGGYILRLNANKVQGIEDRVESVELLAQQNRLDFKSSEFTMINTKLDILESVNKSIMRVHEKIEEGNQRTDAKIEIIGGKIDQMGRDLRTEIRNGHKD